MIIMAIAPPVRMVTHQCSSFKLYIGNTRISVIHLFLANVIMFGFMLGIFFTFAILYSQWYTVTW